MRARARVCGRADRLLGAMGMGNLMGMMAGGMMGGPMGGELKNGGRRSLFSQRNTARAGAKGRDPRGSARCVAAQVSAHCIAGDPRDPRNQGKGKGF